VLFQRVAFLSTSASTLSHTQSLLRSTSRASLWLSLPVRYVSLDVSHTLLCWSAEEEILRLGSCDSPQSTFYPRLSLSSDSAATIRRYWVTAPSAQPAKTDDQSQTREPRLSFSLFGMPSLSGFERRLSFLGLSSFRTSDVFFHFLPFLKTRKPLLGGCKKISMPAPSFLRHSPSPP